MLGMLVLALADLEVLLTIADLAAAMSVEALLGTDAVFAADLQALRSHPGQAVSAANLRALLAGSGVMASHRGPDCTPVQDAYSLRCSPQVHGAARDTVAHAATVGGRELDSGVIVTGNEDGIKHVAMNVLYSLQHLGYTIPPQVDAGWIGEAGPGPSYADPGSGGRENEFTKRNTRIMTWNLLHMAAMLKRAGGLPSHGNQRTEADAQHPNPEYR